MRPKVRNDLFVGSEDQTTSLSRVVSTALRSCGIKAGSQYGASDEWVYNPYFTPYEYYHGCYSSGRIRSLHQRKPSTIRAVGSVSYMAARSATPDTQFNSLSSNAQWTMQVDHCGNVALQSERAERVAVNVQRCRVQSKAQGLVHKAMLAR